MDLRGKASAGFAIEIGEPFVAAVEAQSPARLARRSDYAFR
jgi:hypothetical protein